MLSVGGRFVCVCGLEGRRGGLVISGCLLWGLGGGWGCDRDLLRAGWRGILAIRVVLCEGIAEGFLPVFGAAGVGELVLGELDGLKESLGEVGESPSGLGLDVALDDGGEEAAEGVAEVASGEVLARKEIGYVAA